MVGPNDVVVWGKTMSGKTARMGRRTAAHVDYTIDRLAREHPEAKFHIIQSAYNTGVPESAGTHDKDRCLDVYIEGMSWWDQQKFLRQCGWAAWYRFPPAFGRHVHMISLGGNGPVGIFVPGQIDDYYRHALGLKGQHNSGVDHSWFPANIDNTIFDYAAWQLEEADMKPEEIASAPITMLVGPDDKPTKVTLQTVLRDLEGTQDNHGTRLISVEKKLDAVNDKLDRLLAAKDGA